MSHVIVIALQVLCLDTLEEALKLLGLALRRGTPAQAGKMQWKWYGRWVNDYHAPDAAMHHGISPENYGKCADHVIYDPNNPEAYEIGLVKNPNGPGWIPVIDFYDRAITSKVGGKEAKQLTEAYMCCQSRRSLKKKFGKHVKCNAYVDDKTKHVILESELDAHAEEQLLREAQRRGL